MPQKSLLTLAPKSEFTGTVLVPSPDRAPDEVAFTFTYRDRDALDKWVADLEHAEVVPGESPTDADVRMVMSCAVGWELQEPFTPANVRVLLVEHPGTPINVYQTYVRLSRVGREKN
ncbi:phage tail assembly chaperone [Macromonas nakdongensis]|uniref:phage tail assembly chaperone n=1 Tax=Macromonas nakdongensis TaxID=1843082 RepID=UPI000C3256B3|nr:phage tail assembly chaperone [Macromonas nakdongensis]